MISIAMATHNGERFLEQQLLSLREQMLQPAELVICDDTSTDATVEIIRRFSESALFPIKLVVNNERIGWRANFLKAASLCKSEYIAFCDQDDIWFSNKLSVVANCLNDGRHIFLHHRYRLIDDNGDVISGDMDNTDVDRDAPWRSSYGLTQVFNKSLLEYSDLWDLSEDHFVDNEKMGHDQWIYFVASLLGRITSIDDVLLYYRQHTKNTVGFGHVDRAVNVSGTLKTNMHRVLGGNDFEKKRESLIGIIRRRATASSARARIIESLMSRVPVNLIQSLQTHLHYYRRFGSYQAQRLLVYTSSSRLERLRAVRTIYRCGLYQAEGKQGMRDFVIDMLYGVMS